MRIAITSAAAALFATSVAADVYMHYPRGSNGRCDEKSNNRNNAQKLFDTENNAAGGYNFPGLYTNTVYDADDKTCTKSDQMYVYADTIIPIIWTSQHGCGNGNDCNIVLQMGYKHPNSMPNLRDGRPESPGITFTGETTANAGGSTCTDTPPQMPYDELAWCAENYENKDANWTARCVEKDFATETGNDTNDAGDFTPEDGDDAILDPCTWGEHETWDSLLECHSTEANKGLWLAGRTRTYSRGAIATRQNNGGQRHGYECSEERDYFPYWRSQPWVTFAYLSSRAGDCDKPGIKEGDAEHDYRAKYCRCVNWDLAQREDDAGNNNNNYKIPQSREACEEADASSTGLVPEWVCGEDAGYVQHKTSLGDFGIGNWKYECIDEEVPSSFPNSLGPATSSNYGKEENFAEYKWRTPSVSKPMDFVIRIRYNISTPETDFLDASSNGAASPIKTDPYLEAYGEHMMRVAVNDNQIPRAFQDRSYVWQVRPRSMAPGECQSARIHNVGVMGKRGNIAQVRNCLEYFFVPQVVDANQDDCIHFQWTGSDYNSNGNDGEGKNGSDRSNVVAVDNYGHIHFNKYFDGNHMFGLGEAAALTHLGQPLDDEDLCYSKATCGLVGGGQNTCNQNQQNIKNCALLNRAPAYYDADARKIIASPGTFHFMSTRNNNFSNRDQKMTVNVGLSTLVVALIASASAIFGVGLIAGVVFYLYKQGYLKKAGYKSVNDDSNELARNAERI